MKTLPAVIAALFLVVGCIAVAPTGSSGPSSAASAAPTLSVATPIIPTAAPTVAPTAVPTLPPATSAPTAPPATPSATTPPVVTEPPATEPPATSGPSTEPSSRDEIFADDFTDPSSGWDTGDTDFAKVSYDSGSLVMQFKADTAWVISSHTLDSPSTTVLQAADFWPQAGGVFGLICGDSTVSKSYGFVISADGGLEFFDVDNGTVNLLEKHDDLGLTVNVGASNPVALECSVNVDGAVTMVVGLAHTGPVAVFRHAGGLTVFDTTGIYGEAQAADFSVAVDSFAAWGAMGTTGTMSDGARILYAHIPTDLQNNCYESPVWNTDAQFVVTCVEQVSGKGAEILQYQQFADAAGMNAEYQNKVDAFGVESQGSCKTGPNEATWDVSGTVGGRVQCAPQFVGIRFDWTDDLTNILSTLTDFDGSYADTYPQWSNGGPIIPQG